MEGVHLQITLTGVGLRQLLKTTWIPSPLHLIAMHRTRKIQVKMEVSIQKRNMGGQSTLCQWAN